MKHLIGYLTFGVVALICVACATSRPAVQSIQEARVAIREAELAKAQELASMDLYAAREKLEKAEKLTDENPDQAWRFAEESKADARLAMAKANKTSTEKTYDSSKKNIDSVYGAVKEIR